MGGLITTANDYARYVAWLLAAWPPRDGAEDAILRRSSVREIARPANYAIVFPPTEPSGCARGASYGFGMIPFHDCVLGFHFGHRAACPVTARTCCSCRNAASRCSPSPIAPTPRVARGTRSGQYVGTVRRTSRRARTPPTPAQSDIARAVERHVRGGRRTGRARSGSRRMYYSIGRRAAQCRIAELRKELGACRLADSQEPKPP